MLALEIVAALYGVIGLAIALRRVDWRSKTFSFKWLPPPVPGERSTNKFLAHVTIGTLVVVLWPLYLRIWWRIERGRLENGSKNGPPELGNDGS